jgi:hypothetical protein
MAQRGESDQAGRAGDEDLITTHWASPFNGSLPAAS